MVDVGNGFVTPLFTLILYAAYTLAFVPPLVAGVIGVMVFWQWTYVTSLYVVSFLVARRQHRVRHRDTWIYIYAVNGTWVLFALLGPLRLRSPDRRRRLPRAGLLDPQFPADEGGTIPLMRM